MSRDCENTWENIYSRGDPLNRYPYDSVVTFIYRNYPRDKERKDIKILEVGCGAGNNLWFASREGFDVTGIDISKSAIDYAKKRFEDENLTGNFLVSGFEKLPFDNEEFDIIIDRAALSCISFSECRLAINEINRVLKVDGKFFFNPFSDNHSSCVSGRYKSDGVTTCIEEGINTVGDVCFYGKRDIYQLFTEKWEIQSIQHTENVEQVNPYYFVYADWKVIGRKIGDKNE